MKSKSILTIGTLLLAAFSTQALAADTGCEAQKTEIRTQINYAKSHNNIQQIAGLEKALGEVEQHCTDTSLRKERQLKVIDKESKVAERQQELDKATQSGQRDKIDKKLKKLNEAQEELATARAQLNQ